jgi:hypothetical protein
MPGIPLSLGDPSRLPASTYQRAATTPAGGRPGEHAGREQLAAATPVYLQTLAAEFDKAIADPELQEIVKRISE